jgi:hypothetical protein
LRGRIEQAGQKRCQSKKGVDLIFCHKIQPLEASKSFASTRRKSTNMTVSAVQK